MFKDRLKAAMARENITAAELSRRLNVSRACISLYLEGKTVPSKKTMERLEKVLKIPDEVTDETFLVTLTRVAQVMHCSPDVVKAGLQQGIFPWGYAIRLGVNSDGRTNWSYKINRLRFAEIEHVEL